MVKQTVHRGRRKKPELHIAVDQGAFQPFISVLRAVDNNIARVGQGTSYTIRARTHGRLVRRKYRINRLVNKRYFHDSPMQLNSS